MGRVLVVVLGAVTCEDHAVEVRDPAALRRLLVESLAVLAADQPTQVAWLSRHDVPVDEIALCFDGAFGPVASLGGDHRLSDRVLTCLRAIDTTLAGMSGQEQARRWTTAALAEDAGWDKARRLAREALVELTGTSAHEPSDILVIR